MVNRSQGLTAVPPQRGLLLRLAGPFVVAIILLVGLTVCGIAVIDAARACINGESQWSRGQREASFFLHRYAETHAAIDYQQFQQAIAVPLGDKAARLALESPVPDFAAARKGLLSGRNADVDIGAMMQLFIRGRHLASVDRAIGAWQRADDDTERLLAVGEQLRRAIASNVVDAEALQAPLLQIEAINRSTAQHEMEFSTAMGQLSQRAVRSVCGSTVALAILLSWAAIWRTRRLLQTAAAANEAVRLSKERYQLVLDGSNDGVWDWNIISDEVYFSPRVLEILGAKTALEDLNFGAFLDYLHPEDKERVTAALHEHLYQRRPYDVECRSRTLAGNYLWLRICGQSVRDADGNAVRMAGSITDITEQRITAQRWQFALEDAGEGLWEWDAITGRVTYSPRWLESLGYAADDPTVANLDATDWVHPDDRERQQASVSAHLSGAVPLYRSEHRMRCKDGSYKWVSDRGKVIEWDAARQPLRMIGSHIDITHLKRIEEALARSNSQLKALLDAATHVSIIATDREGLITVFNTGAERLLGYSAADMIGRQTPALFHLRDEMSARGDAMPGPMRAEHIDNAVLMAQLNRWQPQHNDWTYVCKDGSQRAVNLIISPVCAVDGQITGFLGVAIDMTARKQVESALRERETLMRALFEQSPLGMTLTSRDGTYIESNSAFQQMIGYDHAALTALSRDGLFLEPQRTQETEQMLQRLIQDRFGPVELILRRSDGRPIPTSMNGVALEINGEILIWSIIEDITQRRAAEQEIEQLAFYDALTGLPNRRLFLNRLTQSLLRSRRDRRFGALLFLDLDQFKRINDAHNHVTGDNLLQMVGPRLKAILREEDTVARLGGDEFVVLLEGVGSSLDEATYRAQLLAEKLRLALQLPFYFAGIQHRVSASIGVTLFPKDNESADDLMRQADTAMYHVKDHGRDGVCFFAPAMQARALVRLALDRDLQMALAADQLRLFLQPQVDVSGRVVSAEALLRWQHPQQGLLVPAAFISIAEESGLIVQIGEWVLATTCRLLQRLQLQQYAFAISVNISPRQFRELDFVERVQSVVRASGADPRHLVLEITENILVSDIDEAIAKMTALREFGVRWSIDDFGTGYSSLAYLKRLPLQELKIDRSFVADVSTDASDAAIVETILAMARHLNLTAVAEGVETAEQFAFLKTHGCTLFQGYFFGQPQNMLELFPLLDASEQVRVQHP